MRYDTMSSGVNDKLYQLAVLLVESTNESEAWEVGICSFVEEVPHYHWSIDDQRENIFFLESTRISSIYTQIRYFEAVHEDDGDSDIILKLKNALIWIGALLWISIRHVIKSQP